MNHPVYVAMAFSLLRLSWLAVSRYLNMAAQRAHLRALAALVQAAGPDTLIADDRNGAKTLIVSSHEIGRIGGCR
jgi:hypothetical protein